MSESSEVGATTEGPMVTVPARTLIVITGDHGVGYRTTQCFICLRSGWQDRLEHTPDCVVGKALTTQEAPC